LTLLRPLLPGIRLRVGVTGHRGAPKLPAEAVSQIRTTVDDALAITVDAARQTAADLSRRFGEEKHATPKTPAASLAIVSSLAEGADRIVAEAGLAAGLKLETVLPFARQEYMRDFEAADSRTAFDALLARATAVFELDGDPAERPRAYEAAGFVMLANIDLLIAIWDGKDSSGIGGTAQIISRAIADGILVVWIDPARPRTVQLSPSSSEVPLANARPRDTFRAVKVEEIAAAIRDVMTAPAQKDASEALAGYLAETERRWNFCPWYPLLLGVFADRTLRRSDFRLSPALAGARNDWQGYLQGVPDDGAQRSAIEAVLLPAYAAADHLAIFYAHVYRGAYVFNFAFASLAVTLALSGVFVHSPAHKSYVVLAELAVIAAILLTWLLGRRRQWHRRWLDYRRLAESLRQMRILAPIGSVGSIERPTRSLSVDEPDWVNWYVWAVRRLLPLPAHLVDERLLKSLRDTVLSEEIAGQLRYHRQNAERIETLDERLHYGGQSLFALTGIICLIFIISTRGFGFPDELHVYKDIILGLVTFITALLPTVGAAMGAIHVQGDFKTVAGQSKRTAQRLESLASALKSEPLSFARLTDRIEKTSDVMMGDLDEWQMVFRTRPLSLPA
jgi:hypothetical protein